MFWEMPLPSDKELTIFRTYFTTEQGRDPTQEAICMFHLFQHSNFFKIPKHQKENTSSFKE